MAHLEDLQLARQWTMTLAFEDSDSPRLCSCFCGDSSRRNGLAILCFRRVPNARSCFLTLFNPYTFICFCRFYQRSATQQCEWQILYRIEAILPIKDQGVTWSSARRQTDDFQFECCACNSKGTKSKEESTIVCRQQARERERERERERKRERVKRQKAREKRKCK